MSDKQQKRQTNASAPASPGNGFFRRLRGRAATIARKNATSVTSVVETPNAGREQATTPADKTRQRFLEPASSADGISSPKSLPAEGKHANNASASARLVSKLAKAVRSRGKPSDTPASTAEFANRTPSPRWPANRRVAVATPVQHGPISQSAGEQSYPSSLIKSQAKSTEMSTDRGKRQTGVKPAEVIEAKSTEMATDRGRRQTEVNPAEVKKTKSTNGLFEDSSRPALVSRTGVQAVAPGQQIQVPVAVTNTEQPRNQVRKPAGNVQLKIINSPIIVGKLDIVVRPADEKNDQKKSVEEKTGKTVGLAEPGTKQGVINHVGGGLGSWVTGVLKSVSHSSASPCEEGETPMSGMLRSCASLSQASAVETSQVRDKPDYPPPLVLSEAAKNCSKELAGRVCNLEPRFVWLHIYDVSGSTVQWVNDLIRPVGTGAFHAGVEVYGQEWSFGYAIEDRTGVYWCKPRSNSQHKYRESVAMGPTQLTEIEVLATLTRMKKDWLGNSYDLLQRNCCHFSRVLCEFLGTGPLPDWVLTLAGAGARIVDSVDQAVASAQAARTLAAAIDDHYQITPSVEAFLNRDLDFLDEDYVRAKAQKLWDDANEHIASVGSMAETLVARASEAVTIEKWQERFHGNLWSVLKPAQLDSQMKSDDARVLKFALVGGSSKLFVGATDAEEELKTCAIRQSSETEARYNGTCADDFTAGSCSTDVSDDDLVPFPLNSKADAVLRRKAETASSEDLPESVACLPQLNDLELAL